MSIPLPISSQAGSRSQALLETLRQPRVLLTLLLVLFALWLRFRRLGYSEMWRDQSVTLSMALQWVRGGPLPLVADINTAGARNPPLVVYLYAVPLALWDDILGVVWWVGIVNLAGILAAGWATARVFGWRVGWWATLLFVVNPLGVSFARLIWMPSFIPGFAAMFYACVILYVSDEPRARYLILGALCLSAIIQTHLAGVTLLSAVILIGLCFYRRMQWWALGVGGLVFVLSFAPYIAYQFQSRFSDVAGIRSTLNDFKAVNLAAVLIVLDLLHTTGVFSLLGTAADLWRSLDPFWFYADNLITVLLACSVLNALALTSALRRGHEPRATGALMLLLWLCAPLVFFIYHQHYLYTYYFFFIFPVLFPLLALFCDRLYERLGPWLQKKASSRWQPASVHVALVAFLPLALVAIQQARVIVSGQNLLAEGISGHRRVHDVRQALDSARRLMNARPDCQLVILEGDELYDFRALLGEFAAPRRARFAEVGDSYLLPDPCAVYLSTTDEAGVQDWLVRVARPLTDYTIRTPEETWTFYDLPAAERAAAVADLKTDSPLGVWENGARLNHFHFEPTAGGASLALVYTWEIGALPGDTEARLRAFQSGNYLLDSRGTLVRQVDGMGRDSRDWRQGDIFQTVWELPLPPDLPPGEYSIATAFYLLPEVERVPLTNGGGDLLVVERLTLPIH